MTAGDRASLTGSRQLVRCRATAATATPIACLRRASRSGDRVRIKPYDIASAVPIITGAGGVSPPGRAARARQWRPDHRGRRQARACSGDEISRRPVVSDNERGRYRNSGVPGQRHRTRPTSRPVAIGFHQEFMGFVPAQRDASPRAAAPEIVDRGRRYDAVLAGGDDQDRLPDAPGIAALGNFAHDPERGVRPRHRRPPDRELPAPPRARRHCGHSARDRR